MTEYGARPERYGERSTVDLADRSERHGIDDEHPVRGLVVGELTHHPVAMALIVTIAGAMFFGVMMGAYFRSFRDASEPLYEEGKSTGSRIAA